MMSFIWPTMLFSLLLLPILVWVYWRLRRQRTRATVNLGPLGLVRDQAGQGLGRRVHVPPAIFLAGLTVLLIALARPEMTVRLPRIGGTVILTIDVSNSMIAEDVVPINGDPINGDPIGIEGEAVVQTRLNAAKVAAQAFVENQPSTIEVGVVAFGNGGFVVQPPTNLRGDIVEAIQRLTASGNTSLGEGIFTALNAISNDPLVLDQEAFDFSTGGFDVSQLQIDNYGSAVILLLTDGENMSTPDPLNMAQIAAEAGVRIYTVGIGSEEGAIIEVEGFNLVTRLDETILEEVANLTNGLYFRASDTESLQDIYEDVDLQLIIDPDMMEVTSLFSGIGLLLLLIGGGLSMVWFGRI
ncbi:MAG: VWA domain-containing protein [Chloroflexota bacterium]